MKILFYNFFFFKKQRMSEDDSVDYDSMDYLLGSKVFTKPVDEDLVKLILEKDRVSGLMNRISSSNFTNVDHGSTNCSTIDNQQLLKKVNSGSKERKNKENKKRNQWTNSILSSSSSVDASNSIFSVGSSSLGSSSGSSAHDKNNLLHRNNGGNGDSGINSAQNLKKKTSQVPSSSIAGTSNIRSSSQVNSIVSAYSGCSSSQLDQQKSDVGLMSMVRYEIFVCFVMYLFLLYYLLIYLINFIIIKNNHHHNN